MAVHMQLRSFEGHRVGLRFVDGTLVECQLISAPRLGLSTMWILTVDGDAFVNVETITEIWAVADATAAA
jgi:hypothetical protein